MTKETKKQKAIALFKKELSGLNKASVKFFLETGNVSGALAQTLEKIANIK